MQETRTIRFALLRAESARAEHSRLGEFDVVSADYRELTGRPARTLRKFFETVRDTVPSVAA